MSKRFGLLCLAATCAFAQDNADIAPKFRNMIDPATYQQLREDYLNTLRGLPADPSLRQSAVDQLAIQKGVRNSQAAAGLIALPQWTPLGPSPIPNGQVTGALSVTGRTTAMVIDPNNSNKVYMGTAQGGVYRSLDGGTNWAQIFDTASTSAVGALALAPSDSTILFVGTGEANGSADSYAGVGLYRIDSCDTTATLVGPINPIRTYQNGSNVTVNNPAFNGRSISSIIVNPTDPSIVFVGVAGAAIGIGGESPFGNTIPPLGMRGLYRLTNATSAPGSVAVQKLAVTTAASGFDLPNTGNRNIDSIFMDPGDSNILTVWINGTTAAGDGGIYRSVNAQSATPTFTQVLTTTASGARGILRGYKESTNPAVIYVADGETVVVGPPAVAGGLRVSTDGGASWSGFLAGGKGFCGGQCFYNIGIDVLPGPTTATNDDIIVLGGNTPGGGATPSRLFAKSTNGGTSFSESSAGLHADTHFIVIDRGNTSVVFHGDDGGVFKSADGGSTWSSLNNSQLNTVQFSGLAVHPTDAKWSIGGTQDNGTNMRKSDGSWSRVDFGDGGYALIDRNAIDTSNITLYHTYFNQTNNLIGFGRVLNAGCASDGQWAFKGIYGGAVDPAAYCDGSTDTFSGIPISDVVLFYAPMEMGPGKPSTVYFGAGAVYRSANKGDTMVQVSQRTTSAVSTVAVSPQDDNFRVFGRANGTVFYTSTGNTTMTQLTGIPAKYIGRVKFDPTNKNTAYVTLGGYFGSTSTASSHVWKVTSLNSTPVVTGINGGLPDVPVNAFAVNPTNSNNLYAGTDIGVFSTNDGGASWLPYGTDLPVVAVFGMEIQACSQKLRIATHGRGIWDVALPLTTADCSAQFSFSNFVPTLNRATGKWVQNVTITNNGGALANAAFVLDNLNAGWTLANSDGSTSAVTPTGSPYHVIGAMGAGATISFQLQFNRVGTPAFAYNPRLLEGTAR